MLPPKGAFFVLVYRGVGPCVFLLESSALRGRSPPPCPPHRGEESFRAGLRGKDIGEELEHCRPLGDEGFDEGGVSRGGCRGWGPWGFCCRAGAAPFTRGRRGDGHEKAPGRHLPRARF